MLAHLKIADSCGNDNNDFDDDDDDIDDDDDDFDKDDDYDDEKCSAPSVILLHLRPHISPELTWTQCLETRSAQNTQNTKIQGEKYEHTEGGCDKARSMCRAALQHCTLPHFPSLISSRASSSLPPLFTVGTDRKIYICSQKDKEKRGRPNLSCIMDVNYPFPPISSYFRTALLAAR